MNDLQKEEFQIEVTAIQSTGMALKAVKDPKKAASSIAQNKMSPEVKTYRDTLLAAANQWSGFQQRYSALGRTMKTLDRERPNAPANLQADIDALASKFNAKNRALQMKAAGQYEEAADYRSALGLLSAAYQDVPEDKRAGETGLKTEIGDVCSKAGDHAGALAAYKSVLDAKPEKDRYKDAKLCEKLGDQYNATGDAKTSLDMYKHALDAVGGAKPGKDGKVSKAAQEIKKKVDALEKKVGTPAPAAAPAPDKAPAAAKAPAK
jgi:tetratricopeptide (TPR) repeat protein